MGEVPQAWRVAIIDSGLDARSGIVALDSKRFADDSRRVVECKTVQDPTGHGTAVAEIARGAPVAVELLVAQVIAGLDGTTPASVAAAIHWAVDRGANLIHLSLGLAQDRRTLASAVASAIEANVLVVAASPARGAVSFPARYSGVIRATGDARCGFDEISVLEGSEPTFGACVSYTSLSGQPRRGASIGAACLTRFIVSHVPTEQSPATVFERLTQLARYRGRERISSVPLRA